MLLVFSLAAVTTACGVNPDKPSADIQSGKVFTKSALPSGTSMPFRRAIYGSVGVGSSWLEPDTREVDGYDPNDRVNAGGQVAVGVDVSKLVSFELHSADLGSAGLSPDGRINYHETGISALFYTGKYRHNYLRSGITAYGRVGVGLLDNSPVGDVPYVQENRTNVLIGLGLEYMTKTGLGLRAELISFDDDANYGQLGLIYRISKRQKEIVESVVVAPSAQPDKTPLLPPVAAAKVLEKESVIEPDPCDENTINGGVYFRTNSSKLYAPAIARLNDLYDAMLVCTNRTVEITAHTDSLGSAEYNQALSAKRSRSVARYLLKRGILEERISISNSGESNPADTNVTGEGRSRNRRVEFVLQ